MLITVGHAQQNVQAAEPPPVPSRRAALLAAGCRSRTQHHPSCSVREAGLGATKIMMAASRGEVVLSGQVRSWRDGDLAERIARAIPGVTEVKDRITVVG
ncbi:MAG TPA: BON domain-containing protein [Thermoanaerobaculia bacterium]|nr:BON domain-containing protein [Thermoanaerobaculia bacterium]